VSRLGTTRTLNPGSKKRLIGQVKRLLEDRPGCSSMAESATLFEVFSPSRVAPFLERHGFNGNRAFDLLTGHDLLDVGTQVQFWEQLKKEKPAVVGLSPPCTLFSSLQRCGRKNTSPASEALRTIRYRRACQMVKFAMKVAMYQLENGKYFYFEHPWSATSWPLPCIQAVLRKPQVSLAQIDLCAYGLRSPRNLPMKKGTGIMHNMPALQKFLEKQCPRDHQHDRIEGSINGVACSRWAQHYPAGLCKALSSGIQDQILIEQCLVTKQTDVDPNDFVIQRLGRQLGASSEPEQDDIVCLPCCRCCHEVQDSGSEGECSDLDSDSLSDSETDRELDELLHGQADEFCLVGTTDPAGPGPHLPGDRVQSLHNLVQKVHEQLGHPHSQRFIRILQLGGASPEAIAVAKDLNCSTCARLKRPGPQKRTAMPPPQEFNQIVGIDLFFIFAPDNSKFLPVLSVVDWGTLFHQCAILKNKTAECVRRAYRRLWLRPFGPPRKLVSDLGREFTAAAFTNRIVSDGTMHEFTSAESPWQNARTERHGGIVKTLIAKCRVDENPEDLQDLEEIVTQCVVAKNKLMNNSGFSPFQRVFGFQPNTIGALISDGDRPPDISVLSKIEGGDAAMIKSSNMRCAAAKAFAEMDASTRLRRGALSGHRPVKDLYLGQLVYFWRAHGDIRALKAEHVDHHWHGPATVVNHHGSRVWVSYGGTILLCSPEQIRAASEEEELAWEYVPDDLRQAFHELHGPAPTYLDLTQSGGPIEGDASDPIQVDPDHGNGRVGPPEEPVVQDVVVQDASSERDAEPEVIADPMEHSPEIESDVIPRPGESFSQTLSRSLATDPQVHQNQRMDGWYKPIRSVRTRQRFDHLGNPVEIPKRGPYQEHEGSEEALWVYGEHDPDDQILQEFLDDWGHCFPMSSEDPKVELVCLSQQQIAKRKEVNFRRLNSTQRKRFEAAMRKEWDNVNQPHSTKVLSLVRSREIRSDPALRGRIVKTRWVLTEKETETDLETDAKARIVIQGFGDPDIGEIEVSSPTLGRETLPVLLQCIASFGWVLHIGDVKGAFMQSRKLNRPNGPIYAELPSHWPVSDISREQLVEVCVAWYGLNDGPVEFYRSLDDHFVNHLGFRRSKLDPCLYFCFSGDRCSGVVGVTVDDMCFGGTDDFHQTMKDVQQRFVFGKLRTGQGRFCGRDLTQAEDKSISVDQAYYAQRLELIDIPKDRKKDKGSRLNPEERTILREKCGALNWLQGISRPDLSGGCSLLQSSFGEPTVSDLVEANRLLSEARKHADLGFKILPIEPSVLRFGATADSAWANNRDASSQMGYLVFATDTSMDAGQRAPFSPLIWKSHKQKRKVPSTLAAESIAASEALGSLDWVRALFEELTNPNFSLREWESHVSQRPALLLTDCKSVFDSLNQQWTSGSRCDKRTSIDLAIIRDTLSRDLSKIRWIDTRYQLVDCFTKNTASPDFLRQTLRSGTYIIVEESQALALKEKRRKCAVSTPPAATTSAGYP
jgi:hypothetical protein